MHDLAVLQAALLHEYFHKIPKLWHRFIYLYSFSTVEDTATTFEEIEKEFGAKVSKY